MEFKKFKLTKKQKEKVALLFELVTEAYESGAPGAIFAQIKKIMAVKLASANLLAIKKQCRLVKFFFLGGGNK